MGDVRIETEFVETPTLRFEVLSCGPADAERLALCLHGFPEHAFSWRHQLPMLARLGYRVWAPNQRGYGRSGRPRQRSDYHLDALLADVAGLIDASGCRRVTLVGHDWGGLVAWFAALRRLRPLERLVVMNIPHPWRLREELEGSWAQRRRSLYALFFQIPRLPEWLLTRRGAHLIGQAFRGMAIDKGRFPDEVLDVYRRQALEPGAMTAMLHWYRANRGLLRELTPPPPLRTPTLMIWGQHDSALGLDLTRGTAPLVEDFTLRVLPDVSHWVQQEAPEAVNAVLEAWLADRPVPRA